LAYPFACGERIGGLTNSEALSVTLKTYSGSCHCGTVRFEADLDFNQGTIKCNCSSCTKARSWLIFTPAERYRLVAGESFQSGYRWAPPGRTVSSIQFHFCTHCGIRTPGRGEMPEMGGVFYAVQVQLLDDLDIDELENAPIRYVDGRHDRFDRAPEDTRFL
jgi:hypothetical protein